jgi:hypothetical protein
VSRLVISFSFSYVLNYLECFVLWKMRFICFAGPPPVKFCSDASRKGVAEKEESHRAWSGFDHNACLRELLPPVQVCLFCLFYLFIYSSRLEPFSIWFTWFFKKLELHMLSLTFSHCLSNSTHLLLYAIFAMLLAINVIYSFLFWALLEWFFWWEHVCLAEFVVFNWYRKSHICTKQAARHVQNKWFRLSWGEVPMTSDRKPELFDCKRSMLSSNEFLIHGFYFWLHQL